VGKHHQNIKNTSRTHCNFPGILQEILACIGVQITRTKVYIARKSKKLKGKPKPAGKKPKPQHRWIRIQRPQTRENGSGLNRPGLGVFIKRL